MERRIVLKCYSTRLRSDYREDDNEASGVKQGEKLLDKVRLSISQERASSKDAATLRSYTTPTLVVTKLKENRLISLLSQQKYFHFPGIHSCCQMISTYLEQNKY